MINQETLDLYTLPELQKLFREKMGLMQDGDWGLNRGESEPGIVTDAEFLNAGERAGAEVPLRLPLPLDPFHPGRDLWGMVEWNKRIGTRDIATDGTINFFNYVTKMSITDGWQPPTIALLKALREQVKT